MMETKPVAYKLFIILSLLAGGVSDSGAEEESQVTMKNDYWQITVEPRWGGRVSSMLSLKHDYDFVSTWKPEESEKNKTRIGKDEMVVGGAMRNMMSGSYHSSQPQEPYTVVSISEKEVFMTYDNLHAPLLDGLREERKITLDGSAAVLSVKVTNTGKEDRNIYYRMHDFIGVGLNRGLDSIFVVPWEQGAPFAYARVKGAGFQHKPFLNPTANWFALADIAGDKGLLVTVEKTDVAGIFFWGSDTEPLSRTAEIFFPHKKLVPGASWEMELSYAVFSPSAPDLKDEKMAEMLTTDKILEYLERAGEKTIRAGLPYAAEMALPVGEDPAVIIPVHLIDPALEGGSAPDYNGTLKRVRLAGAPGEAVPLVIGVKARTRITKGQIAYDRLLPDLKIESRYAAGKSRLLVRSWELSRNIPVGTIGAINNDVKDAAELTPFTLEAGDVAYIYSLLRVPENAVAGAYGGKCVLDLGGGKRMEFDVALTIRPFKLIKAKHKTYGGFFRYFIKSGADDESKGSKALTRDEYLQALKSAVDVGYNGLVLYVSAREDLIWTLDQCKKLGMTGGFVLCRPGNLTVEDIAVLNKSYNIMGWGVDEPIMYKQIPGLMKKYKAIKDRGLTPVFTPNVPLGLLAADALPDIVPIIAMSGNMAYGMEATRRYKNEGRQVYWYRTGQSIASLEQRVFRGIYLWKGPVDGILDWGEDSVHPEIGAHQTAGFAGTEIIPRLGRENIRQALIDLDYLNTLEKLADECKDEKLRGKAENIMNWIKAYFGDDWYKALEPIKNPQYLDDIRHNIADMIEEVQSKR